MDRATLRAHRHFYHYGIAIAATSTISLGATIALTYAWGANGFFLSVISTSLVRFFALRHLAARLASAKLSLRLHMKAVLPSLTGIGLVVLLYRFAETGMRMVDRFYTERSFGLETLGIYSMAVALSGLVQAGATSVGEFLRPTYLMHRASTSTSEINAATMRLHKAVLALSYILTLGVVWFAKPVIDRFFPVYASALLPIYILCLGQVIMQGRFAAVSFLFGTPSQYMLPFASVLGLIVSVISSALLVAFGMPGIAAAATLAYTASAIGTAVGTGQMALRLITITTISAVGTGVAVILILYVPLWLSSAYALGTGGLALGIFLRNFRVISIQRATPEQKHADV
jgi:O-antigen/teichoic acid export membrane protein